MKEFPKPTAHLPSDHASSPGESNKPGLANPVISSPPGENDEELQTETGSSSSTAIPIATTSSTLPAGDWDEGIFDGMENLASGSSWVYGAAGVVVLVGLVGLAVGLLRWRKKRRDFGGADERGSYGMLRRRIRGGGEEGDDVAMGMLSGRKNRRAGIARTKELYDAFGDVTDSEEEEEDEDDQLHRDPLGYHE